MLDALHNMLTSDATLSNAVSVLSDSDSRTALVDHGCDDPDALREFAATVRTALTIVEARRRFLQSVGQDFARLIVVEDPGFYAGGASDG